MSANQIMDSILNNFSFMGEHSVDEDNLESSFPLYLTWLQKEKENAEGGLASDDMNSLLESIIGNESFVMTLQEGNSELLEACGEEYETNGSLEGLDQDKKAALVQHYLKWLAEMIGLTQGVLSGSGSAPQAAPSQPAPSQPSLNLPSGGGEAALSGGGQGSSNNLFQKTPKTQKKELFHGKDLGAGIGIFKEKTPPSDHESIFKKKKKDFFD